MLKKLKDYWRGDITGEDASKFEWEWCDITVASIGIMVLTSKP